ncbi:unnamed protein product [Sphagnum jensenii]|uniref:DUF7748 domain-containing protein n=1 Tax=Sphagnum jensenii TaxID=128206 RepID=A0ABP1AW74_9BRYO
MVKQKTTLINATRKPLELYEEASNGSQRRMQVLDPGVPEGDEANTVLVTSQSTRKTELAGHSPNFYVHSVDPNDSYATLRLWCGKKAVLGVNTDDMIDNITITIEELQEGVFSKRCEPRNPQNQPARTSEDAASTSEGVPPIKKHQSTSSLWGNFINFVRPRKSANTNAGK